MFPGSSNTHPPTDRTETQNIFWTNKGQTATATAGRSSIHLNIHSVTPLLLIHCIHVLFLLAGRPQPAVRWLINGEVVDDQYEHNFGDVIENRLMRPPLYRENLGAIFTCQAVNTLIVKPKESSYVLDMLRKSISASSVF